MKKFLAILLALALVFTLVACKSGAATEEPANEEATGEEAGGSDKLVIGCVINSLDEAQTKAWNGRAHCVAELYSDKIELQQLSAEGDLETQIAQVETFITDGVDLIYLCPLDASGCSVCVDECNAAGIPIVASESINTDGTYYTVGFSMFDLGAYQGMAIEQFLNENPDVNLNCAYILGDLAMQQTWDTKTGTMDYLEEKGLIGTRVNFVEGAEGTGNWTSDEAMSVTEDYLIAYPEVNCFVCQSGEMAVGSLQACLSAGKEMGKDMFVFGKDGNEREMEEIGNGNIAGTVFIDSGLISKATMVSLCDFALGKVAGDEMMMDPTIILASLTASNLDEMLVRFDESQAYVSENWDA